MGVQCDVIEEGVTPAGGEVTFRQAHLTLASTWILGERITVSRHLRRDPSNIVQTTLGLAWPNHKGWGTWVFVWQPTSYAPSEVQVVVVGGGCRMVGPRKLGPFPGIA